MKRFLVFAVAVFLVSGYGLSHAAEQKSHDHGQSEQARKMHEHASGQSGFTLMQVMQDLGHQVSRIQHGILANNRLMIKQGAAAIADHPAPKGGIKPYVKKNADQVKDVIPQMDRIVHQTAVQIAESADTAAMIDLQNLLETAVSGCVGCHNLFRD